LHFQTIRDGDAFETEFVSEHIVCYSGTDARWEFLARDIWEGNVSDDDGIDVGGKGASEGNEFGGIELLSCFSDDGDA
jgi:hypothetical protein